MIFTRSWFALYLLYLFNITFGLNVHYNRGNELDSKSYSNITFIGAHDSAFIGNSTFTNQGWSVTRQLNDGIRLLQSQIHKKGSDLHLCHTNCLVFDGGKLEDYLKKVKSWIDENDDEVVTTLFTNSDSIDVSEIGKIFESSGIKDVSYTPSSATVSNWPTISDLKKSGKRVVNFMDYHADFNKVPYIIDEFSHIWEDGYNAVTNDFPCTKDRGDGEGENFMYLHNHFLDKKDTVFGTTYFTPDVEKLGTTNGKSGKGSLGESLDTCAKVNNHYPNFILVDYYSHGNGSVFEVAAQANGISYQNPGTIHPPSASELADETDGQSDKKTSDCIQLSIPIFFISFIVTISFILTSII